MVLGIENVLSAITTVAFDRGARDDDTIDRLNHLVMHCLLLFLAVAAGARQYVGTAIYCWSPPEFDEKIHRRYVNHYCWINSMYSIPFDEPVPAVENERYYNDVSFYRLATALFLALAVLFRIPQLLWKELTRASGAKMEELVGLTTETTFMDLDKRDQQLSHVAEFFHRWVTSRKHPERKGCMAYIPRALINTCLWNRPGQNLVFIYLFIKFLYLLNVIGQFFIISAFLKTNYWTLGLNAVSSYVTNGHWSDEYNFPRVAHCDIKIRQLENVQPYTVQCVLAINAFLEKMFLLLWFCLVIMMFANAVSFSKWSFQLLKESRTIRFLGKYFGQLVSGRAATPEDRKKYLMMLRNYLQADGMFVIRMVAVNTTDTLTLDLVRQIWIRYKKSRDRDTRNEGRDGVKMNGSIQDPYSCEGQ